MMTIKICVDYHMLEISKDWVLFPFSIFSAAVLSSYFCINISPALDTKKKKINPPNIKDPHKIPRFNVIGITIKAVIWKQDDMDVKWCNIYVWDRAQCYRQWGYRASLCITLKVVAYLKFIFFSKYQNFFFFFFLATKNWKNHPQNSSNPLFFPYCPDCPNRRIHVPKCGLLTNCI